MHPKNTWREREKERKREREKERKREREKECSILQGYNPF
jgi:hypothetical protein